MNNKKPITTKQLELKDLICKILDDGKASDIVSIDLRNKTPIADYMIIASGSSTRHNISLADKLKKEIKDITTNNNIHIEGLPEGNWILVDFGDIIVHIFKPETRQLYNLENMWQEPLFSSEQ